MKNSYLYFLPTNLFEGKNVEYIHNKKKRKKKLSNRSFTCSSFGFDKTPAARNSLNSKFKKSKIDVEACSIWR